MALPVKLPPLQRWRRFLVALWLLYDLYDVVYGRSASTFLGRAPSFLLVSLAALQGILICSHVGILCSRQPWRLYVVASLARCCESLCYPLNDFFYVAVMLAWGAWLPSTRHQAPSQQLSRYLIYQTAWIYFATALLKINPSFLRGGDLYVRQNYLSAVAQWPYPAVYQRCLHSLACQEVLAYASVACEMLVALALLGVVQAGPAYRRACGWAAVALSLGVHGGAALTNNVWFFGLSMVAQVTLLVSQVLSDDIPDGHVDAPNSPIAMFRQSTASTPRPP